MAGKRQDPIEWEPLSEALPIAGFGTITLVNDPQYWGRCIMVDGKHNGAEWKVNPLWAKTITGRHPQFTFDGEFLKRHQNLAGDPHFWDQIPDEGYIQIGDKVSKDKIIFTVKGNDLEEISPDALKDLL